MAKKKDKEIKAEVALEELKDINEESTPEEVTEHEEEVEVSTKTTDAVIEQNDDQFIFTQLQMINRLNNPAKARRLADRVLRNRKR